MNIEQHTVDFDEINQLFNSCTHYEQKFVLIIIIIITVHCSAGLKIHLLKPKLHFYYLFIHHKFRTILLIVGISPTIGMCSTVGMWYTGIVAAFDAARHAYSMCVRRSLPNVATRYRYITYRRDYTYQCVRYVCVAAKHNSRNKRKKRFRALVEINSTKDAFNYLHCQILRNSLEQKIM